MNAMGNQAVKMLIYDWSADPLFHEDKAAQEIMNSAQKKALERYFQGGVDLRGVLRQFVWESGLLEKVARSFDLEVEEFRILMSNFH